MDSFDSCTDRSQPQISNPDFLDSSVTLEKSHIEEGYKDGYNQGLILGRQDAYNVGLKQGFISCEELGFYRGLINVWWACIRVDPDCFSGRVKKTVLQMKELIEKYPLLVMGDPENEGRDEVMDGLRLKFKAVCASLGVKLDYDGYPHGSGSSSQDNLEF